MQFASGGDVICGTLSHEDNNVLFAELNELDIVVAVDLTDVMPLLLLLIAGGGFSIVTLLWVSLFIILSWTNNSCSKYLHLGKV